jgi:hypothetical protein
MKYIKRFNESKSEDMKWSDRDVTNKYHCALGWVRYTDAHKDSYIDIERYFDITFDHLGWVLEDLVNTCDLFYGCSVRDVMSLSHEDSDGVANYINIDLVPAKFGQEGYNAPSGNFKKYLGKFTHFPPRKGDELISLLRGIEDNLIENFPYLTIVNDEYVEDEGLDKWNLFVTSSQITLKIERK